MTDGILDFENSIETFLMHLEDNERAERERRGIMLARSYQHDWHLITFHCVRAGRQPS